MQSDLIKVYCKVSVPSLPCEGKHVSQALRTGSVPALEARMPDKMSRRQAGPAVNFQLQGFRVGFGNGSSPTVHVSASCEALAAWNIPAVTVPLEPGLNAAYGNCQPPAFSDRSQACPLKASSRREGGTSSS